MKLCMIGTGYVGLVSGVCFSDLGNDVICVDKDINKINNLKKGVIPIYEPGLEEMVLKNFKNKRLNFSSNLKDSVRKSDIIFICVGTPTKKGGASADLSQVYNVAKELGADYINLSDNFVLTDIIEPAKEIIKWYDPNIIYLNETRFIDNASFLAFHMVKEGAKVGRGEMFTLLEDGMSKTLNMFETVLQHHAPNSKIIWDLNLHYLNSNKSPVGFNFASKNVIESLSLPVHTFTSKDISLDLGRDGVHPGIEGHKWMTNRLVKIIGEYFE